MVMLMVMVMVSVTVMLHNNTKVLNAFVLDA
jgi:hypothetical protein